MERMRALATAAVLAISALVACSGDQGAEPPPDAEPACESGRTVEPGTSLHEFERHGETRTYTVHVPPDYDPDEPPPAVFTFHGLGGTGHGQAVDTGLAEVADAAGFVLLAPDGRGMPQGWDLTVDPDDPDSELAFTDDLVERVDQVVCVDPDRRYVTGHSNGSVMAFAVACHTDIEVAAVGGMGAIASAEHCTNDRAIPWIYLHAGDDPVVPFDGGDSPIGDLGPVSDNLGTWAVRNGCDRTDPQPDTAGNLSTWSWADCDADAEAVIAEIGGHYWPQTDDSFGFGLDAGEKMWEFFERIEGS